MYKAIYEQLAFTQSAVYQIKFTGILSSSQKAIIERHQVSIESFDREHPISMLTGKFSGQTGLLNVLNALHDDGHSIISLACVEVLSEDDDYASV